MRIPGPWPIPKYTQKKGNPIIVTTDGSPALPVLHRLLGVTPRSLLVTIVSIIRAQPHPLNPRSTLRDSLRGIPQTAF